MKHLLKPVYLLSDTNNFIISFHKLQGVDFCLYGFCHHEGFYKGPVVEIKSIENAALAFISIGYDKGEMNIIKNQLISKGNTVKFKADLKNYLYIGITSYGEWLNDQTILANSSDFSNIIQSKIMAKTSDIKLIVNSGNKKEEIKCHSNHLCIKSRYFINLLESGFAESKSGEIDINCSKEAIIPILQYIYTGEIDKNFFVNENYEFILEMYSKVCEYQMEKVKGMVEVFILAFLDKDNVKLLLQSTILNRDDPFTMTAINFIADYFK